MLALFCSTQAKLGALCLFRNCILCLRLCLRTLRACSRTKDRMCLPATQGEATSPGAFCSIRFHRRSTQRFDGDHESLRACASSRAWSFKRPPCRTQLLSARCCVGTQRQLLPAIFRKTTVTLQRDPNVHHAVLRPHTLLGHPDLKVRAGAGAGAQPLAHCTAEARSRFIKTSRARHSDLATLVLPRSKV